MKSISFFCLTYCFVGYVGAVQVSEILPGYLADMHNGEVTYILSYPRSGNSWFRYLVEFETQRPTLALQSSIVDRVNSPLGIHLRELKTNFSAKPVWKVHTHKKIIDRPFYDPQCTRMVLIIRNYKENVFRESDVWELPLFDCNGKLIEKNIRSIFSWYAPQNRMSTFDPVYKECGGKGDQLYFDNIYFYDQLPEENKLLIYYEDLIQDPRTELDRMCEFFGCSKERIEPLMKDYELYRQHMLGFYPLNKTNGSVKVHYSKKYSVSQCIQIDTYVKNTYPDLWDTYLSRYQEK